MKNYIPTIEDLRRKPITELHVIFRNAAEIEGNERIGAEERQAASRTVENVKIVLRVHHLKRQ